MFIQILIIVALKKEECTRMHLVKPTNYLCCSPTLKGPVLPKINIFSSFLFRHLILNKQMKVTKLANVHEKIDISFSATIQHSLAIQ